jgi:hypothetical protein
MNDKKNHPSEAQHSTRRDWLRFASLASAGLAARETLPAMAAAGQSMIGVPFDRKEKVRMGFIGVGGRGTGLLRNFAAVDGVEVVALCDLRAEAAQRAAAVLAKAGQTAKPEAYTGSERAFEKLAQRADIDLVCIATPWNWHVPQAVYAMQQGKHVAVEVPAANTLDECWQLVNTSEKMRRHCTMMENCCYGYNELLVLNMVKAGMFGELTHGGAAYNHDLRGILFANGGEGLWRRHEHFKRNGNLYPTHGLGPVAHYMNIDRGDRFEYLVSMSSPSLSLYEYRKEHVPPGDPKQKETYVCGDQNTSLIKTAKGRVITLEHNVASPQPYDRINLIAGTKGIFRDYPPRIYIDSPGGKDAFTSIDPYKAKFEHPYWTKMGEIARKLGGHGGMDFIECYRLIECMKQGIVPDMDVYDAASWSAPAPLSEMSVAKGSAPVPFPDFTRGRWKEARA